MRVNPILTRLTDLWCRSVALIFIKTIRFFNGVVAPLQLV
jgi:hypothetical protein